MFWKGNVLHELGTLGGEESLANAITNAGEVTGMATTGPTSSPVRFSHFFKAEDASMDERERQQVGMIMRRSVLGDAHVDRAEAEKTAMDAEFQDLITRYAWGEVWTRPGMPRHTRSLITIALMVALNHGEELRLHLRAAANNGVTPEEIREVLLHCAIYCGVPAANAAFHAFKEAFTSAEQGR